MPKEIIVLPAEFQIKWMAQLHKAPEGPAYRLVNIEKTDPRDWRSQRITVMVRDLNGFPEPGVHVAFSFSTAEPFYIPEDAVWTNPPQPRKAFIPVTEGGGQIEHIQGSAVKEGEPGGVTVYIAEFSKCPSDVVTGMGMLADHTGVVLEFQYIDPLEQTIFERIEQLEDRIENIEGFLNI